MGHPAAIPLDTCRACFLAGGITGGTEVRAQWREARLTVAQEGAPRPGCVSCGGVRALYRRYPELIEKFQAAAVASSMSLGPDGLYRNGVLQRAQSLPELAEILGVTVPSASLWSTFERVVVISLARRRDRLSGFLQRVREISWPFREPEVFAGVDGERATPPEGWVDGKGAWGCRQSHARVLEECLTRGVKSVLILEDDAHFEEGFSRVGDVVQRTPADWEILMLGGQHIGEQRSPPIPVEPGIVRCVNAQRCHAYGVRGAAIAGLYKLWRTWYPGLPGHCDHQLGPWAGARGTAYAPTPFVVSQGGSLSDICGRVQPVRNWS